MHQAEAEETALDGRWKGQAAGRSTKPSDRFAAAAADHAFVNFIGLCLRML